MGELKSYGGGENVKRSMDTMKDYPRIIPFWLWGVIVAIMFYCAASCYLPQYTSPSGKAFPRSWGKPPEIQTKDYVPLPDGYGYGSSTLYHWIEKNKK